MRLIRYSALCLLLIIAPILVIAQDDDLCPIPIAESFASVQSACADADVGTLCLGAPTAFAMPFEGGTATALLAAGDSASVSDVAFLSLSTEDATWGTVKLQTTAYDGISWQPQPVLMLAFGNVQLRNLGNENLTLPTADVIVTPAAGANVRSGPTTEHRVLATLFQDDVLKAIGILNDSQWLQVMLPDGQSGWIAIGAVSGDISILPIVTADAVAPQMIYPPFAAFNLQTGTEDAPCPNTPESGVLIHTPSDAAPLVLLVNGAALRLNGLVFLQAQSAGELVVNVLMGQAEVSAMGETQVAQQGARVVVPMNAMSDEGLLAPADVPLPAEAYDYGRLASLPLELLPQPAYVGVLLEALITPPAAPGRDPLAGVPFDAQCTIAASTAPARVRSGPGTSYPIIGEMPPYASAQPDGLYAPEVGDAWWRLAPGAWVAWQAVFFEGACDEVPPVVFFGD